MQCIINGRCGGGVTPVTIALKTLGAETMRETSRIAELHSPVCPTKTVSSSSQRGVVTSHEKTHHIYGNENLNRLLVVSAVTTGDRHGATRITANNNAISNGIY